MKKTVWTVLWVGMFLTAGTLCFADAYGDLDGMRNTGVTFDGSDPDRGQSQGIDTYVNPSSGDIPEPPPPPPPPETTYVEEPVQEEPVQQEPVLQEPVQEEPVQQPPDEREGTVDADTY